ncbi:MAG: cyclic nucleotide-binding domain-containing protein, partial [Verrucomicrobiota bacterium]
MKITKELIERVAGDMEVSFEELEKFAALGSERIFAKGDYLFHESAPRRWFGIVLEGKINLQRGLAGRHVTIACLTEGAVIGESLFIDDLDHSVSGLALEEAHVWVIPKEDIEIFKTEKPEIYYHI